MTIIDHRTTAPTATANAPSTDLPADPGRRRGVPGWLGWLGVGVTVAASACLAVAVLRPDPAPDVDPNARTVAEHGSVAAIDHRDAVSGG